MAYKNILFDLDGTLTDPKVGITKSVQYALTKFNITVDNLDTLEPFIGPPLTGSFMDFYGFSEEEAKKAVTYYREYFSVTGMYENDIYEGIISILDHLKKKGKKVIVATSKPTVFAEEIIKHFKMDTYIDEICGSNLDGSRSNKTEIIRYVLDNYVSEDESVVMIGDRKYDIIGAKNNDIDSIAVGYGYGSEDELKICEPTYYVNDPQGLLIFIG